MWNQQALAAYGNATRRRKRRRAVDDDVQPFSPEQLSGYSFYTSGSRADVGSGAIATLTDVGGRPTFIAAGGPTVASNILSFDGTDDTAAQPAITTDVRTLNLVGTILMPVASGSGVNGGFTCTGIDRLPNGLYAVGNDGRGLEGDGSTNINASIVIMHIDLDALTATIVTERTLSSMGIATTTGSVQGVAYVSATNKIAFAKTDDGKVYLLNADTYAYEGAWSSGAIVGLNGLAYAADCDSFVTNVAGISAAVFRDRITAAVGKTVTIDGVNSDMLWYCAARKSLFASNGANGFDGTIQERRASAHPGNPIVTYTLTGSLAIEGIYVSGNKLLVVNDGSYHESPGFNRAVIQVYDLPPLPAVEVWPIAQSVEFYGIIHVTTPPATTGRCIASIGNAFASNNSGAALVQLNGDNTKLLLFINNLSASFTVPALSTKCLVFGTINLVTDVAELWINSVSMGQVTLTANTPNYIDPAPACVGSDRGSARFFQGDITCIGATVGHANLLHREKLEGFAAWDTGNTALLPASQAYATVPPTTGPPIPRIPLAFGASDWSVVNQHDGGTITIIVTTLPYDGGATLQVEYKIDAGAWTFLSGATTGSYDVAGLTDGVLVNVGLRAVNSVGAAAGSATKAVIPTTGYAAETETLVAKFTTPPTATRKDIIDQLIANGKIHGWYVLADYLVVIGADSQCSLINWINGAPDATLINTPTFTADRDWTTNGIDNGIEFNYNPTVHAVNLTQNAASAGFWSRQSGFTTIPILGWYDGTDGISIRNRTSGNLSEYRINNAGGVTNAVITDGAGLFVVNRSAATGTACTQFYQNGVQKTAQNVTSAAMNNHTLRFGGFTATQWQVGKGSAFIFGGNMNATIQGYLYADLLAYMTAIGAA